MKKVYVVTSGCYSDYGIETIFSNKRDAKEWIKRYIEIDEPYDKDEIRIEEYYLDIPKKEWVITNVRMKKNGDVDEVFKRVSKFWNVGFVTFESPLLEAFPDFALLE